MMKNWHAQSQSLLREYGFLCLLSVGLFLLTRYSVTYGAGSDPRYTLIVSQSILDNGTIQLNSYQDDEIWGMPAGFDDDPNILKIGGRYYNYFPAGPSILSLPFVVMTKAVGWDMRRTQDNINAQRLLSSFSAVLVLWLVYSLVRVYLGQMASLVITAVSVFGSTLISTLGTAWWSTNICVIFIGLGLLLLVRYDGGKSLTVYPILLGTLLFLAYLSRAAAATFIVAVFLYLGLKDWRQMVKTAVVAAFLLALFLLWSHQEFGSWLPIYYSPARLQVERTPLWLAIVGHLLSPARGLFIYSPFFVLLLPGLWLLWPRLKQRPLLWLCLLWLLLHLYVASRGTSWWGGHSFGPRILTELMLPLTLLTAWLWREAQPLLQRRQRTTWAALYLLLGVAAVFIHSYQGLYNYSTILWNVVTQVYPVPPFTPPWGDLFNWRYPQFLATNQMLCTLDTARAEAILPRQTFLKSYQWGTPLSFDPAATSYALLALSQNQAQPSPPQLPALFAGWEPVDNDRAPYRTGQCDKLRIYFQTTTIPENGTTLVIRSSAFGRQRAFFSINGQPAGEWHFQQQPKLAPETAVLSLDPTLFQANAVNELTISLPDAQRASYRDPVRLALAIDHITICPTNLVDAATDSQNCPSLLLQR
jgi:hypothetical protein